MIAASSAKGLVYETINISDIILAVDLILNGQFNNLADINEDGFINIQDIILLINIILN